MAQKTMTTKAIREFLELSGQVRNGQVWTVCTNCGGSGSYPSSAIPAGQCRLYCWRNRTPETFGKHPAPVARVARRVQSAQRRNIAMHAEISRRDTARAEFCAQHAGLDEALDVDHMITRDLSAKLTRYGSLSEKQVALALRIAREQQERTEQREAEAALEIMPPAGRQEITGEVVTAKWKSTAYGDALKMLVKVAADGGNYRLWGTVPSSVLEQLHREALADHDDPERGAIDHALRIRGRAVTLTAKVDPKEVGFGFYSRPTKAALAG